MNNINAKELAKSLYLYTDLTQKEIASIVGITDKTLGTWTTELHWKEFKDESIKSNLSIHKKINAQILAMLNQCETETRRPTKKEANVILKLTQSMDSINKGLPYSAVAWIIKEYENYIKSIDPVLGEALKKHHSNFLFNNSLKLKN